MTSKPQGVPGEIQLRHEDNMHTAHKKEPAPPHIGIKRRTYLLWGQNATHRATVPPSEKKES